MRRPMTLLRVQTPVTLNIKSIIVDSCYFVYRIAKTHIYIYNWILTHLSISASVKGLFKVLTFSLRNCEVC